MPDGSALDKYYTNRDVALDLKKRVHDLLGRDFPKYAVEPSAGSGSFIEPEDGIVAFDLKPEFWWALKPDQLGFKTGDQGSLDPDFLAILRQEVGLGHDLLAIGNPPFGEKSALAVPFVNAFLDVGGIVAFVVPNSFRRWSIQSQIEPSARLIADWDVPSDAFHLPDGTPYDATRCAFQVWSTRPVDHGHPDLRVKSKPLNTHDDFDMRRWNGQGNRTAVFAWDYDFAVRCQGYGDYRKFFSQSAPPTDKGQYMMFKAKHPAAPARLKAIDFQELSTGQANTPGFSMWNVVDAYDTQT